jgi:hypothetical protein
MFQLPASTLVNRRIPKSKFYEKLQANHHLRELFTEQVEAIIWKHKLSKDTVRLEPKGDIEEIQIFEVHLKGRKYSVELLRSIDRAIPYPILYVLLAERQAKLAIAYKERNQSDANRSVVQSYHETDWQPNEKIELNILQGLDLKAVYENIIRQLLPVKTKPDVEVPILLERQVRIDKLTKECERLEYRIRAERQFHRKVELNLELQRKKKELNQLREA